MMDGGKSLSPGSTTRWSLPPEQDSASFRISLLRSGIAKTGLAEEVRKHVSLSGTAVVTRAITSSFLPKYG